MIKREASGSAAAILLSEFFDKHLQRGTGNAGNTMKAAEFAEKSGLLPSTISELRNRKRLPKRHTLDTVENTFFPDKGRRANDPAYLEWQEVRAAIENERKPNVYDPDEKRFSLRQAWDLMTRPITSRVTPIVRFTNTQVDAARDQITARLTGNIFILPMPDWFIAELEADAYLRDRYDIHAYQDLTGNAALEDLFKSMPIAEFPELLAYHSSAYAHLVLETLKGSGSYLPYNKKKIGLCGYRQVQRSGRQEGVFLDLDLYETDYFTHRVMRRVFLDLRLSRPTLFSETPAPYEVMPYLRYFTTSFGMNIVATTRHSQGRRFYMTRLSARQGNANQHGLWHVSANEGVSFDDVIDGAVIMGSVVERALKEELGVCYHEPTDETLWFEFAIDQRNLEPYISCLVHLATDRDAFYRSKMHLARDDRREFQDIRDFPFSEQAIIQMLVEEPNGVDGFTSYSLNILDNILLRGLAPRRHD